MLHRFVKLTFTTENIPVFLALFDQVKDQIKANAGCQSLQLLQDQSSPNIMYTYSIWSSDEDLQAYRNSPLFGATWKNTKALFEAPAQAWSTSMISEVI